MSERALELDASIFASRMRSHKRREVKPVQPRGQTSYLRKHPIAEVWTPDHQSVKLVVKQETIRKEPTQTVVAKPIDVAIASSSAAAPRQIDFSERANKWQLEKQKDKPERRALFTQRALVAMAVAVFIVGVGATIQTFMTNKKVVETVSAQSQNNAIAATEEDEPSDNDVAGYSVSPNMPRLLHIPKFGVKSRVRPVGVDGQNKMQAPTNVHDAGWFKDSVLPGSPGGASVIDGHVSGPTKKGVFYRLKDLVPGDKVQVERGDGKLLTYNVVTTKKYDANNVDMNAAMLSVKQSKHGLNLITCAGEVVQGAHYSERLIVFTELES